MTKAVKVIATTPEVTLAMRRRPGSDWIDVRWGGTALVRVTYDPGLGKTVLPPTSRHLGPYEEGAEKTYQRLVALSVALGIMKAYPTGMPDAVVLMVPGLQGQTPWYRTFSAN